MSPDRVPNTLHAHTRCEREREAGTPDEKTNRQSAEPLSVEGLEVFMEVEQTRRTLHTL